MLTPSYNSILLTIKHRKTMSYENQKRQEIMEAYLFLREKNQSIPSDTLELMKDAALESLVSKNESIGNVSGISTDLEKDLFVLINKYAKAGLDKPHAVARLEWVLGSVKKS